MLDLRGLQKQLKKKEHELRIEFETLTKHEKDILARTVKLQEEVGELANDILSTLSLQRPSKLERFDKNNLYEELADVLLSVVMLANALDVDMERAVEGKLHKLLTVYQEEKE